MTIGDLKAVIESDIGVSAQAQVLYFNGQELPDASMSLEQANIKQDEMLGLQVRNPQRERPDPRPQRQPTRSGPDPEAIRLQALGNPSVLEQVRAQNPELANAVNDRNRWGQIFGQMIRQAEEAEAVKQRELALLNADPFNVEAQAKIEEMIRQQNVMENLQHAMDYHPEAFGRVHMLYIDVEVNGHKVKAFVDSGAQATIMSPSCAEKCEIMRLVDRRYAGEARGVGTAKIIGRVHSAQITVGSLFLPCTFSVMEGRDVDLLFGLDMLKRHQACIDLRRGKLVIQNIEVDFLGEADIPKHDETIPREQAAPGPSNPSTGASQTPGQISEDTSISKTNPNVGSSAPEGQDASRATSSYPAAAISQVMELCRVSKQVAIGALGMAGGDVAVAVGLLSFND
ncbi:MAG: hypothetical protein Q9174_002023 [Haloplaca sp. 1 TL-2023]